MARVLFISSHGADAARLRRMLNGTALVCDTAGTVTAARSQLLARRYDAVLTEAALPDGGWLEVLDAASKPGGFIPVIVTRPVVDGRLWAEVLNRGGYDMLAQPFSEPEVRHVLSRACSRIPERGPAAAGDTEERVALAGGH